VRAQLVATVCVFVATWLLHGWQHWWLSGRWPLSLPDALFWGVLGALVVVNVRRELRAGVRKAPDAWPARAVKTAATFSLIVFLWSLWSSPTLAAWLELITYGRVG
jgi:Zn-dependent protease